MGSRRRRRKVAPLLETIHTLSGKGSSVAERIAMYLTSFYAKITFANRPKRLNKAQELKCV